MGNGACTRFGYTRFLRLSKVGEEVRVDLVLTSRSCSQFGKKGCLRAYSLGNSVTSMFMMKASRLGRGKG